MPRNSITDLRNHLFEVLENLKDCEKDDLKENIERARSICSVAKTIISTGALELQYEKIAIKGEIKKLPFCEVKEYDK